MRIGSTLLLKNQKCYQSYGWKFLRPLGDLQTAVNLLEEYGVDEIAIIRICRDSDSSEYLINDLKALRNLKCMTPISFGGGIRNLKCLEYLEGLPVERLILSSLYGQKNKIVLKEIINLYGKQAIVALLPLCMNNHRLRYFASCSNSFHEIDLEFVDKYANEVIIYDLNNEGFKGKFDKLLLPAVKINSSKLILSGGVDANLCHDASRMNFAAVYIDNRTLHSEYSINEFRNA